VPLFVSRYTPVMFVLAASIKPIIFVVPVRHVYKSYLNVLLIELRLSPGLI